MHWPDLRGCQDQWVDKALMTQRAGVRLLARWLAFVWRRTVSAPPKRIYTVHHRGDRPRECERCPGKARCPTSKKTEPTAQLRCLCGWGPYPAAGAISTLNLVASALYRSPVPVLLVSTNLGLQRKSRLRLCIRVLISSSRRVPCSVPRPEGDGDRPPPTFPSQSCASRTGAARQAGGCRAG